ncbi:MAG: hypothetical protein WC565_02750 [Parcubacteria group bacterium]
MSEKIVIVKMPPGFAEERIRKQWCGLQIPLATPEELKEDPPSNISIGAENRGGYFVLRSQAIKALRHAGKNEAADFWESLPIGRYLRFNKDCCELV